MRTKPKILQTNDIIQLIRQDKSLYNRGLDKISDQALLNVLKNRFKISNFACDFSKIKEELAKNKEVKKDNTKELNRLLYNAIVLLLDHYTKNKLANELCCSTNTIDKILEG